jgi:hypothetical protein
VEGRKLKIKSSGIPNFIKIGGNRSVVVVVIVIGGAVLSP